MSNILKLCIIWPMENHVLITMYKKIINTNHTSCINVLYIKVLSKYIMGYKGIICTVLKKS